MRQLVGGLGTVISWRVVYRVLAGSGSGSGPVRWAWMIALLLAAPLCVVGVYSIYPHPIYDCDCAFSILIAVFCLQCAGDASSSGGLRAWVHPGLAGAACVAPVFFKQNMGLPFLLAVVAGALFLLVLRRFRDASRRIAACHYPGSKCWFAPISVGVGCGVAWFRCAASSYGWA